MEQKPGWMSDEGWQDQQEELAAWTKRRLRQRGGREPAKPEPQIEQTPEPE
jgi:hypothetical protein